MWCQTRRNGEDLLGQPDCHQGLTRSHLDITLEYRDELEWLCNTQQVNPVWVPAHYGVRCNVEADELARRATVMDLVGPEPAVGFSSQSIEKKANDWVYQESKNAGVWSRFLSKTGAYFCRKMCGHRSKIQSEGNREAADSVFSLRYSTIEPSVLNLKIDTIIPVSNHAIALYTFNITSMLS